MMLSIGEMAAFMPIAEPFCTFAGRFVDDAFGFALTWNYWFNDAVPTGADSVWYCNIGRITFLARL
jgi:amino acid permease